MIGSITVCGVEEDNASDYPGILHRANPQRARAKNLFKEKEKSPQRPHKYMDQKSSLEHLSLCTLVYISVHFIFYSLWLSLQEVVPLSTLGGWGGEESLLLKKIP